MHNKISTNICKCISTCFSMLVRQHFTPKPLYNTEKISLLGFCDIHRIHIFEHIGFIGIINYNTELSEGHSQIWLGPYISSHHSTLQY